MTYTQLSLTALGYVAALACAALACTPRDARIEQACAEEGVRCVAFAGARVNLRTSTPDPYGGERSQWVQWSPYWCSDVGSLVCAWAVRHERGHQLYGRGQDVADCYAASVAPQDENEAAHAYLTRHEPHRALTVTLCRVR